MQRHRWFSGFLIICALAGFAASAAAAASERSFDFDTYPVQSQTKPGQAWRQYDTRVLRAVPAELMAEAGAEVDEYGGWLAKRETATGFFYPKYVDNRWWLVDPLGYRFLHKAVVSVSPGSSTAMLRARFEKFGTVDKWADATTQLLWDNGFNGTGAWSSTDLLRKAERPVVYTMMWNFMSSYGKVRGGTFQQPGHTGYPKDAIFVFDPEFPAFCDNYAKQLAATKDDPYLLGHFSDNELPFPFDLLDKYLSLPETDPGYKAAYAWLSARQGGGAIRRAAITPTDRLEWAGYVADRYFSIVKAAIAKYDPNHLYLGPRLHGFALNNKYIFEAAGRYVDVIGINYYNVWTPSATQLKNWAAWSGRPIMITEYYTKGADAGLPNTSGAGWVVRTQDDRGRFYQNFVLALIESGVVVGWHWFKYADNDPADLTTDPSNRDANKGIVRINYEPYEPLLAHMQPINVLSYWLTQYFDERRAAAE